MRIAIYIGNVFLLGNEWKEMVETLFLYLAERKMDDDFVFILNKPLHDNHKTAKNSSVIMVPPESGNSLLLKYWYNYTLPTILQKNKIDVLVSASGVCSLGTKLPQFLFLKDISFLTIPQKKLKKRVLFIKKRFPKCLEKANSIVVTKQLFKNELIKKFSVATKINVVNTFANPVFKPIDWRQKDAVKDKYSEGKEYFVVNDNNEFLVDWMVLLKAFSLFKKRQLSNMQLLVIGGMELKSAEFSKKMETYKYRADVKLLGNLPVNEQAVILAAAYCLVHVAIYDAFAMPILQALQSGVPIIAPNTDVFTETIAGAALYADFNNSENISEQMKTMYKDENKRSQIMEEGMELTQKLTMEISAADMWKCIQKVMN